ncbi:hypothetical protein N7468_010671 [Penicillium chermesinum]|uniref:Uncharacterized protein n=1 Tax=Penicillium chermesinum TaxID=63820 RepID=A0A9W9N826_9EURO|nr:uncharacterized protein N7468_010671 [Penicillium chermesinum]KAJ5214992.1 hypothetical protein N7468_010671 [Penicillium chermesinum]
MAMHDLSGVLYDPYGEPLLPLPYTSLLRTSPRELISQLRSHFVDLLQPANLDVAGGTVNQMAILLTL